MCDKVNRFVIDSSRITSRMQKASSDRSLHPSLIWKSAEPPYTDLRPTVIAKPRSQVYLARSTPLALTCHLVCASKLLKPQHN